MPRRRQPTSLRQASLLSIASNIDDFWRTWDASNSLEDRKKSDVFTPFQYLGDDMIQEIIDMIGERKSLHPSYLQLLLHPNIRRLELRYTSTLKHSKTVMKTLGRRCQKLTHLTLGLKYIDNEFLATLLTNSPQLISLNLPVTTLDDDAMAIVSKNCPNLLDLNAMSWNADFLQVCKQSKHYKVLPNLRKLTSFDCVSAHTLIPLLESFSCLRYLGYFGSDIDLALEQMYGEEFQSSKVVSPEWIHKILTISIDGNIGFKLAEADRLDLTFQCCPFVTDLTLLSIGELESFSNISKLKHLNNLFVQVTGRREFSACMVPVLLEIGDNLTSLHCQGFKAVNLAFIGKVCVNLESLEFELCTIMTEHHLMHDPDRLTYFTKLKKINYLGDIDGNLLSLLLQNATELQEIGLTRVNTLTDEIISDANKKHGLRHLRSCYLWWCFPISVKLIWKLLSSDNPLEILSVGHCANITSADMDLVRHEAILRQFDINIPTVE